MTTTKDSHDGLPPPTYNSAVFDYRSNRPATVNTTTDSHDGLPPPAYSETDPAHDLPTTILTHACKYAYLPNPSLLGRTLLRQTHVINLPADISLSDFMQFYCDLHLPDGTPVFSEISFINQQGRKGGIVNEGNWHTAKSLLKQHKGTLKLVMAPIRRDLGVEEKVGAVTRKFRRKVLEKLYGLH